MDRNADQRLLKFARYLPLIEPMQIRDAIGIEQFEKREGAPPLFDNKFPEDGWEAVTLADGAPWGAKQSWTLFRAEVAIPKGWEAAHTALELRPHAHYVDFPWDDNFPAGPEGQVFIDGARAGAIDQQHTVIRHPLAPGKTAKIEAVFFAGRCRVRHGIEQFRVVLRDPAAEKPYHDLRVALAIVEELDERSVAREKIIAAIDAALHAVDVRESYARSPVPAHLRRDPEGDLFRASLPAAQRAFDEAMAAIEGTNEITEVLAVGHAHIDLAWLWPISQTRHKGVRTFATQCRLLDQWPEWVFQQSSPQAYRWLEADAPDVFARVKAAVEAGRWEPEGGMWCESDTNIPGGESLVRQFVHGKRHFREMFGIESEVLWLPDVFGYSAAMPQIMRLAGIRGFVTSKISWNQFNRFPHDTFRWRGLDGSEVPTHFITTPYPGASLLTYNATITPHEVRRCWEENRQRHLGIPALMSFGWGDGGGGPTEEMLENAQRLATWKPVEGMPRVKFGKVREVMAEVEARASELPAWDGELYLEFHRGTYTSHAWLKRANRKCETKLHTLEALLAIASLHGHRYDRAALDLLWEDLLLTHFHDILPGSSVNEVYTDEIKPMIERIGGTLDEMIEEVATHLAGRIDTGDAKRPVVVFNTLDTERNDPIHLGEGAWVSSLGVPPMGWKVIDREALPQPGAQAPRADAEARVLENARWRLRFDDDGHLAEVFDKENLRPVLAPGEKGNVWQVFEDRPLEYDAWDIDQHSFEHPLPGPTLASFEVTEQTPERAAVELRWTMPPIGEGPQSEIHQRVVLWASSPRIDFETEADWHEHHQLLKVAFPVNVRAREATYQIQFGHLTRSAHHNTSWDQARFEVCAHRFIDLGEHDYGVSLMNDCKYGHDVRGNVMRLTCIKCAQAPDAEADQGAHAFTYSLLPHAGTFQEAQTRVRAAELNVPVLLHEAEPHGGDLPSESAFVRIAGAVLETLKPAEDGDGLILRIVEEDGGRGRVTLDFEGFSPRKVSAVDLLERPLDPPLEIIEAERGVSFDIGPFQIVTLCALP